MLSEAEIKAMVLERLLQGGRIQKRSLVFNEMNLAGKVRRLDLAYITDGEMVAIEVKSEKDSLSRLAGQLDEYIKYFDRVIVVAASKFVDGILFLADSSVEIWEVCEGELCIHRRGRKIKGVEKSSYLNLMTKREVSILARMVGVEVGDLPMYDLKIEVANRIRILSKEKVKKVLINGLEKRFSLASNRFLLKVSESGRVDARDIPLLSPYQLVQGI